MRATCKYWNGERGLLRGTSLEGTLALVHANVVYPRRVFPVAGYVWTAEERTRHNAFMPFMNMCGPDALYAFVKPKPTTAKQAAKDFFPAYHIPVYSATQGRQLAVFINRLEHKVCAAARKLSFDAGVEDGDVGGQRVTHTLNFETEKNSLKMEMGVRLGISGMASTLQLFQGGTYAAALEAVDEGYAKGYCRFQDKQVPCTHYNNVGSMQGPVLRMSVRFILPTVRPEAFEVYMDGMVVPLCDPWQLHRRIESIVRASVETAHRDQIISQEVHDVYLGLLDGRPDAEPAGAAAAAGGQGGAAAADNNDGGGQ